MTSKRRRLLQARISMALRDELGRTPTSKEIEKYSRLAAILFKSVGGVIAIESKRRDRGQLRLWK